MTPLKPYFLIGGHDGIVGIAAGDNGPGLRGELPQFLNGLFANHAAGNGQVHDYGVKGLPRRPGREYKPRWPPRRPGRNPAGTPDMPGCGRPPPAQEIVPHGLYRLPRRKSEFAFSFVANFLCLSDFWRGEIHGRCSRVFGIPVKPQKSVGRVSVPASWELRYPIYVIHKLYCSLIDYMAD
jgi:hypothetical protein